MANFSIDCAIFSGTSQHLFFLNDSSVVLGGRSNRKWFLGKIRRSAALSRSWDEDNVSARKVENQPR